MSMIVTSLLTVLGVTSLIGLLAVGALLLQKSTPEPVKIPVNHRNHE